MKRMCKCNDSVKLGNYNNQTEISYKGKSAWVDLCVSDEVLGLWKKGIETTGCCCGHNITMPYIGVKSEYVDKMLAMGYQILVNTCGAEHIKRVDSFYPKSVRYSKEIFQSYMESVFIKMNSVSDEGKVFKRLAEYQLPMAVKAEVFISTLCPKCEHDLSKHVDDGYYRVSKVKFCPSCGQRLDWK